MLKVRVLKEALGFNGEERFFLYTFLVYVDGKLVFVRNYLEDYELSYQFLQALALDVLKEVKKKNYCVFTEKNLKEFEKFYNEIREMEE